MVEDIVIEITIRRGPFGGHEAWLRHRLIVDRRAREVMAGEETTPEGPPSFGNYFRTSGDDPETGQRRFAFISAMWGETRRVALAGLIGLIEEWTACRVRVDAINDGCGCDACRAVGAGSAHIGGRP